MTKFVDPTLTLAAEAIFAEGGWCGATPSFAEVVERLASMQDCTEQEAHEYLRQALDEGEVRLRFDADEGTAYLAIDGHMADIMGIRVTFMKLYNSGLQPTDIYTGEDSYIVEAYQPLLIEALETEGVLWPI